jgi:hypothetical protein
MTSSTIDQLVGPVIPKSKHYYIPRVPPELRASQENTTTSCCFIIIKSLDIIIYVPRGLSLLHSDAVRSALGTRKCYVKGFLGKELTTY